MKKALKIIGAGVIFIAGFMLGTLGGYEIAWYELFTRKYYGAAHMLEDIARYEWKKTPEFIFHCWTSDVRSKRIN
jgi:hypothetical protein